MNLSSTARMPRWAALLKESSSHTPAIMSCPYIFLGPLGQVFRHYRHSEYDPASLATLLLGLTLSLPVGGFIHSAAVFLTSSEQEERES